MQRCIEGPEIGVPMIVSTIFAWLRDPPSLTNFAVFPSTQVSGGRDQRKGQLVVEGVLQPHTGHMDMGQSTEIGDKAFILQQCIVGANWIPPVNSF